MGLQICGLNLDRACKELEPHGTPAFPCAGYASRLTDREEDVIPWHWHDEIEMVWICHGQLKLQLPGKTYHLQQGDGVMINSNILHFAVAEPCCKLHSLVFHPLLVTGNDSSVFARKYMSPLTACTACDSFRLSGLSREGVPSLSDVFEKAFEALALDMPGYEFVVREALSTICLTVFESRKDEILAGYTALDQNSIRMRKMLDYIHNHYWEDCVLPDIAKSADIGERECLRCFQRVIQLSPIQYLLKYRISQGASMLLGEPDISISQVAGQCGFDSPSNFSHTFKRFYKCTPREYRKRNLPGEV